MSCTVPPNTLPAGTMPGTPEDQRDVRQLSVDALADERAAVLEELVPMIAGERDHDAAFEAKLR